MHQMPKVRFLSFPLLVQPGIGVCDTSMRPIGKVFSAKVPFSSGWAFSIRFGKGAEGGSSAGSRSTGMLGLFVLLGGAGQIVFQRFHRGQLHLPRAVNRPVGPHLGAIHRRMHVRRDESHRDALVDDISHQPIEDPMLASAFPRFDERGPIRERRVIGIRVQHRLKIEPAKP